MKSKAGGVLRCVKDYSDWKGKSSKSKKPASEPDADEAITSRKGLRHVQYADEDDLLLPKRTHHRHEREDYVREEV